MIGDNELSGTIPTEVGLFTSMWFGELELGRNKFEGSIPSELGLLASLWTLDLGVYYTK